MVKVVQHHAYRSRPAREFLFIRASHADAPAAQQIEVA